MIPGLAQGCTCRVVCVGGGGGGVGRMDMGKQAL